MHPAPSPAQRRRRRHPVRRHRRSCIWAVPTIGGWHVDYAGVTMLLFLGVAMAIMAYVLVAGSTND